MATAARLDYWREERDAWAGLLGRAKDEGFGAVESVVPWALHVPAADRQEWGAEDRRLDLSAFLQLCGQQSLEVALRLGPGDDALPGSGYTGWGLDEPAVRAIDASGAPVALAWGGDQPFFAPSYAARAF